eukprot:scaffold251630_cov55-Attheya_sp.AAC.1
MSRTTHVRIASFDTQESGEEGFLAFEKGRVRVQRPKTSLSKEFLADSVFSSKEDAEFVDQTFSSRIASCLSKNQSLLCWTFGTQGTGKSTLVFGDEQHENVLNIKNGLLNAIASQVCSYVADVKEAEATVSISFLCTTGDTSDRLFDCLLNTSSRTQLRLRETSNGIFYVDGLTEVVIKDLYEITTTVLAKGLEGMEVIRQEEFARLHSLVTCHIHLVHPNGDLVSFDIQVMDLCGPERPQPPTQLQNQSTPKTRKVVKKRNMGKEDRTLKAIHRVVDALSLGSATNGKRSSRVPYRDSKLTRLLSRGLGGASDSIALICVSDNNVMYDETSAMLEFMAKV